MSMPVHFIFAFAILLCAHRSGAIHDVGTTMNATNASVAVRNEVAVGKMESLLSSESAEASGGMDLNMNLCPMPDVDSMKIGTVAVYCENIKSLANEQAVHCGLQAAADGHPSIVRRYDLGPRDFQLDLNPFSIAAISIHCTEGEHLHGKKENVEQIEWGDAPRSFAKRGATFGQMQEFIRNRNIVASTYDLVGGNCQHFTFLMYELMTMQKCNSIKRPNDDSVQNMMKPVDAAFGGLSASIIGAFTNFSKKFQEEQGVRSFECDT